MKNTKASSNQMFLLELFSSLFFFALLYVEAFSIILKRALVFFQSGLNSEWMHKIFDSERIKLASFKEEQRSDRSNAASHMSAAVFATVVRSGRSDPALK